ncbi:MAG: hypothetical protein MJE77_24195 [Proteobacteria bacterium]|nr:hypothetical protein [Pseudomonadota bacterium]
MSARLSRAVAVLAAGAGISLAGQPAWADAHEHAATAHVGMGTMWASDVSTTDHIAHAPTLDVDVRYSYGLSHIVSFEVSLGTGQTLRPATWQRKQTQLPRHLSTVRVESGVRARFLYPYMPSVYLGIGTGVLTYWHATEQWIDRGSQMTHDRAVQWQPLHLTARVGVDYRLDKHWLAGLGVTARRTIHFSEPHGYAALEAAVAYHWY